MDYYIVEKILDQFFKEYCNSQLEFNKASAPEEIMHLFRSFVPLDNKLVSNDLHNTNKKYVNKICKHHFDKAANQILVSSNLIQKISAETCLGLLMKTFLDDIPRYKLLNSYNPRRHIDLTVRALNNIQTSDQTYFFPLVLNNQYEDTQYFAGPISLLSIRQFEQKYDLSLTEVLDKEYFIDKWTNYLESYDHIITVKVEGHEAVMAWNVAREAAEFFLNLIRMAFKVSKTRLIRLASEYKYDPKIVKLSINFDNDPCYQIADGFNGVHIKQDALLAMFDELTPYSALLVSYIEWFVSGEEPSNSIIERIKYFTELISEACTEPNYKIKLVRLMSALECLTLLERKEKAHNLALNCAYLGSQGDTELANDIYKKIEFAYRVRSQIVHGENPISSDVTQAFYQVEQHLIYIFLNSLGLYASLSNSSNLQSIRKLRREFKRNIEWWFWTGDIL